MTVHRRLDQRRILSTSWTGRVLAIVACVPALGSVGRAADPGQFVWKHAQGESLALQRGETTLWQFNYAPDQPKPFFHPVALPNGKVLTCNAPPDHPWHHGLWFSWKFINRVNYWEPVAPAEKPAGRTEWQDVKIGWHTDGSARIAMQLTYRPVDKDVVLTEDRIVVASAPDSAGSYHFDWTSTFTAGPQPVVLDRTPLPGEPEGVAWGGYAGLSVRLAKELVERQAASSAGPVDFQGEDWHRGRATAVDYSGAIDQQPAGIAICDHPDNANHPSPWYTIRTAEMSYFSPAVICYGPLTLQPDQKLTLRYRVLVHAGRWQADQLQQEFARFVADSTQSHKASGG